MACVAARDCRNGEILSNAVVNLEVSCKYYIYFILLLLLLLFTNTNTKKNNKKSNKKTE